MSSRVLLLHRRRAHTGYRHFPCQSNPYPQPLPSPAPTSGAFARDLNSGALHPSKRRALREWIPPSILSPGFCVREQNSASRANPAPFSGGGIMANGNSQFGGNNSSFFDAAARGGNNSQFRGKQFTVPGAAAQGLEVRGSVLESSPLRSFPGGSLPQLPADIGPNSEAPRRRAAAKTSPGRHPSFVGSVLEKR